MPKLKTAFYEMTGYATIKTYSQAEMADALGVTETRLVGAIQQAIGLAYHRKPPFGDYEFNQGCYDGNKRKWACYRDGGHNYQPSERHDYLPNGAEICTGCGYTRYG